MRLKTIAALALGTVLFVAPQAFALGGGGGSRDGSFSNSGDAVNGSFTGGRFNGTCSNGTCTGTYRLNAAEPFTTLALGLGLLGAGYLRRRRQ